MAARRHNQGLRHVRDGARLLGVRPAGTGLLAETVALVAANDAAGAPALSQQRIDAINLLFVLAIGHGLLGPGGKVGYLGIHALGSEIGSRIHWENSSIVSQDRGLAGGLVPWSSAGFNPGNVGARSLDLMADPSALTTATDACLFVWIDGALTADPQPDVQASVGTFEVSVRAGSIRARVHSAAESNFNGFSPSPGFVAINRTAANVVRCFGAAGTQVGPTRATPSGVPTATDFNIGSTAGGGPTANRNVAVSGIATGMTPADIQNLRDDLDAFRLAFGP